MSDGVRAVTEGGDSDYWPHWHRQFNGSLPGWTDTPGTSHGPAWDSVYPASCWGRIGPWQPPDSARPGEARAAG